MASTTAKHETSSPPPTYSLHNIGRALFDMNIRFAKQEKELLTQELKFEAFARQQHVFNKRTEESLAKLAAIFKATKEPPDPPPAATMERGWQPPPSLTQAPPGIAPAALPRLRVDPPRFDGENAVEWICNMQIYYNHHYTPLDDRLYLTKYLFDHPASEWMAHWMDNNAGKGWDDFLLAVKQRFDPDLYEDSVVHDLLPHSPWQTRGNQPLTHATSPPMQQHAASQSTTPASRLSVNSRLYREFPVVRTLATQAVEVTNSEQVVIKSMTEDIGASTILSLINVPSNEVDRIIVTGGSIEESTEALAIAETDARLSYTVGVHPTRCREFDDSGDPERQIQALLSLAREGADKEKVVAVGECGLNYDRLLFYPAEDQRRYFEKQFELAYAMKLPMFLHARAAAEDLCNILERNKHRFFYGIRIFDP